MIFKPIFNTENGEIAEDILFHYKQDENIVTAEYKGSNIKIGHLIGIVAENGSIDFRYHQINNLGQLRTGICQSYPEILENGKIRLYEKWQWASDDMSSGNSIIEEI